MIAVALPGSGVQEVIRRLFRARQHRHGAGVDLAGKFPAHHLVQMPQKTEAGHIGGRVHSIPAAYVGMMGSRGRAALVRRQLLEAGADAARVEAVQAPIGLAIGAKTAEEIALSILAQIVEVKNARPQTEGFAPALLAAMEQAAQNGQPAVLATIIARHGSTPREVGSKMLLLPDGTTVGSVGGGIMEYRTRQAAAEMLAGHTASVQTVTFSADGKNEDAAVAACGGSMELLLEIIPEGGSIE